MGQLSRRNLLKLSGATAATSVLASKELVNAEEVKHEQGHGKNVLLDYPEHALPAANTLKVGEPVAFNYPDNDSPCALLKLGHAVSGGVGEQEDIVAYSVLCSHRGCVVNYDHNAGTFKCPCHFSIFDPEKRGQMVCGQAVDDLPRVVLTHNREDDSLRAVAVEGLIYGRVSNILVKG